MRFAFKLFRAVAKNTRSKSKQEKARGCLAFPSQGTADGNADRTRLCMAFKNGYKSFNLGVAAIKTSLI